MLDPTGQLPDETLIEDVKLPTRIKKALLEAGLVTVGEARNTPDKTLKTVRRLAAGSIIKLRDLLGSSAPG